MKLVTTAQTEHVKKVAKAKGVDKGVFQERFIDGGLCAIALDAAQQGARIKLIPPIVAPTGWGGRIHFVEVEVDEYQSWLEAVDEVGQTPDNYNVRKVGDPSTGNGKRKTKMVLVNLANGGDFAKSLLWAELFDLKKTSPRHVFAIGKQKPELHKELGMDSMYVVSSEECTFGGVQRVCGVWWHGTKRKANLNWVSNVRNPNDWVALLCYYPHSPST